MIKYLAFEAYEGRGDSYYKLAVCKTREEAFKYAKAARIHIHLCKTKQDLEMVLEDSLTDAEAAEWAYENTTS